MCLKNALTLIFIYAEGEAELQEASSEAELHGHSLGGTDNPGAVGWHVFWLFDKDGSGSVSGRISIGFESAGFGFGSWFSPTVFRVRIPEIPRVWGGFEK